MAQIEKPLLVLVVVPSTDLVKQWKEKHYYLASDPLFATDPFRVENEEIRISVQQCKPFKYETN